jgi:hypothetical protein
MRDSTHKEKTMADSSPVGRRRQRENISNDDVGTKEGTSFKRIKLEANTPSEVSMSFNSINTCSINTRNGNKFLFFF